MPLKKTMEKNIQGPDVENNVHPNAIIARFCSDNLLNFA